MSRYIDADDLISVLDILSDKGGDIRYWEQLKWIVKDCPTIDVVKRGQWTKNNEYVYVCSVCGKEALNDEYGEQTLSPYCGMCGAKMDEVGE